MTDVILIHSPMILNKKGSEYIISEGDERSNYPMGILYIASYLESRNISVKVLDVSVETLTIDDIVEEIEKEKPRLVGISSTTPAIRSAVKISKIIRSKFGTKITVGIGGAHVNSDHTFFDRFPYFDFMIKGEGELTLYNIYKKITSGETVTGVIQGESVSNLDDLPLPARHLINYKKYLREEVKDSGFLPAATIISSRGCPYQCSFCSIPIIKHKVRYRSAIDIVDEMESIYDTCDGWYSFQDDVLTLNKKRTIELCDEISKRKLKVRWCGMTRANALDEEMIIKMAKAGCDDLAFGVEAGSERVRNQVIKKKVTTEEIKSAISLCRKYGIHTSIFLMVGFPTETLSEIYETVNIGRIVGADMIGIRISVPFPGTEVYDYSIKNGIVPKDALDKFINSELCDDKEIFFEKWPLFIPIGLKIEQLIEAKKTAYKKFYLNPKWILRRILLWIKKPSKFKEDWGLIKMTPYILLKGKTKGSMS